MFGFALSLTYKYFYHSNSLAEALFHFWFGSHVICMHYIMWNKIFAVSVYALQMFGSDQYYPPPLPPQLQYQVAVAWYTWHNTISETRLTDLLSNPVHWSSKKVGNTGNQKDFFLNKQFVSKINYIFMQFGACFSFYFLFLFLLTLWNRSGKDQRKNTSIIKVWPKSSWGTVIHIGCDLHIDPMLYYDTMKVLARL